MLKSHLPINAYPNRMLSRSLVVVVLSALGLLCGVAPDVSGRFGSIVFSSAAYAQEFSDSDIAKFARAAFSIEVERRNTQQKIRTMTGGNAPEISCDQPQALTNLSENVRSEFVDFCKFSADKIKENNLEVGQFNAIKTRYNSDPAVKKRVNEQLRRLRS
ncbi:DUF4168 domain-containing protein [Synechocystis sp. PCC 7509]|uniref:DUF4168 domain-containing protein n=1 Tax=Synechocystis sp. PCC 7509 TaxID=927677 RepID=UPI0002ABC722|nr:DUF4168 domain-containing protein [Synechocystis sp. PCC 7509]